jgi:hypothetical protein
MRLRHSGIHWKLRCTIESSDKSPPSSDENTPPNVSLHGSWRYADGPNDVLNPSRTATPPYLPPEQTERRSKTVVSSPSTPDPPPSSSAPTCASLAPPPLVILETPRVCTKTSKTHHPRRQGRQERREAVAPYLRQRSASRPAGASRESIQSTVDLTPLAQKQASRPRDTFVPARWP